MLERAYQYTLDSRTEDTSDVIFIPYMPHVEKHLTYNHPLVPLIAAGLTREG